MVNHFDPDFYSNSNSGFSIHNIGINGIYHVGWYTDSVKSLMHTVYHGPDTKITLNKHELFLQDTLILFYPIDCFIFLIPAPPDPYLHPLYIQYKALSQQNKAKLNMSSNEIKDQQNIYLPTFECTYIYTLYN